MIQLKRLPVVTGCSDRMKTENEKWIKDNDMIHEIWTYEIWSSRVHSAQAVSLAKSVDDETWYMRCVWCELWQICIWYISNTLDII